MQGWLSKGAVGEHHHIWKKKGSDKRYFSLSGGVLKYYKGENAAPLPKGTVPKGKQRKRFQTLREGYTVAVCALTEEAEGEPLGFSVEDAGGRQLRLVAPDEASKAAWTAALRTAANAGGRLINPAAGSSTASLLDEVDEEEEEEEEGGGADDAEPAAAAEAAAPPPPAAAVKEDPHLLGRPRAPTASLKSAEEDDGEYYNTGLDLMDEGRDVDAVVEFSKAIRVRPADADAIASRGNAYINLQRWSLADGDFKAAIELAADDPSLWFSRGLCLEATGSFDDAYTCLSFALELDEEDVEARQLRGVVSARLEHHAEAVADYEAVIASGQGQQARDADAAFVVETAKRNLSLSEKALTQAALQLRDGHNEPGGDVSIDERLSRLTELLALREDDVESLLSRGVLRSRRGEMAGALKDFEAAMGHAPSDPRPLLNRGNLFAQQGELERAEVDFSAALALDSGFVDALRNRGIARFSSSQWGGAAEDFSRAISRAREEEAEPEELSTLRVYSGQAHAKMGELGAAYDDFGAAVAAVAGSYMALAGRAEVCAKLGQSAQALGDWTAAIELSPKHAEFFVCRAAIYLSLKRTDEALADFEQAVTLDPASASALSGRGQCRTAQRNYDGAIADLTRALSLDPSDAHALMNRGEAHNKKGEFDEAVLDFRAAAALDPANPEIANALMYASSMNHAAHGAVVDAIADAGKFWLEQQGGGEGGAGPKRGRLGTLEELVLSLSSADEGALESWELVDQLTQSDKHVESQRFLRVMLASHPTFCSGAELLAALKARFHLMQPEDSTMGGAEWEDAVQKRVRSRVVSTLRTWLLNHPEDFSGTDGEEMRRAANAICDAAADGERGVLRGLLDEAPAEAGLRAAWVLPWEAFDVATFGANLKIAPPRFEKKALALLGRPDAWTDAASIQASFGCGGGIADFDAEEVARQLTLLEQRACSALKLRELLQSGTGSETGSGTGSGTCSVASNPKVLALMERQSRLTRQLVALVLREPELKRRVGAMCWLVALLDALRQLRNYAGASSALLALSSAALYRLSETRGGMGKKSRKTQDELSRTLQPEFLRKLTGDAATVGLPFVPFVAVQLEALVSVLDLYEDSVEENGVAKVNVFKRERLVEAAETITACGRAQYALYALPPMHRMLEALPVLGEEEAMRRSEELE